MSMPFGLLPIVNAYAVAPPAVQLKVTVDDANVDPGAGLTITAAPDPGEEVGVAVGAGEGVPVGVGVGVGEVPVAS
jgi:hypothetical protein